MAADYISKWEEAISNPKNDAKEVTKFLKKNIFNRFRDIREIISDRGSHLCKTICNALLASYGTKHKVSTTYYPQMSGQTKVSNRETQEVLEKLVSMSRKDWPSEIDDANRPK